MKRRNRRGFSLIELLIVLGIIGLLIQLALPAVQSAREAARRTMCSNQMRQIGIAWMAHLDAHKHYPTGGWGSAWTGDPERGYGAQQPGGWAYNILPFIEQSNLHSLGRSGDAQSKAEQAYQVLQTPINLYYCPSRRLPRAYPMPFANSKCFNATLAEPRMAAKVDYAACLGDLSTTGLIQPKSPTTLEEGDGTEFQWPKETRYAGLSFVRSTVSRSDVKDGTTKTYMLGEKWLQPDNYKSGSDKGDNEYFTSGMQNDTYRSTAKLYKPRPDDVAPEERNPAKYGFGSAHPGTWQALFADGSVQSMSFEIDAEVHRRNGTRAEGK